MSAPVPFCAPTLNRPPKEVLTDFMNTLPEAPTCYRPGDQLPMNPFSAIEQYFADKLDYTGVRGDHKSEGSLSPEASLGCLADEVRTKRLMQAIATTVGHLDETQPSIDFLEAGGGAAMAMSIWAALCSDKVRATVLEYNPHSAILGERIVKHFGLDDRIEVIETDATAYTPRGPVDVLLSETMDTALTGNEPVVQIMQNLVPYVRPGGVILPSQVDIMAALVSVEEYDRPELYAEVCCRKYPVVRPTWEHVQTYTPGQQLRYVTKWLSLADQPEGEYKVAVASTVTLGKYTLGLYDSLITRPNYVLEDGYRNRDVHRTFKHMPGETETDILLGYKAGGNLTNAAKRIKKPAGWA